MRITKISVKKLFGVFDHEIPLNQESRITILHGPNGVGKTVLLRMVDGLFERNYQIFNEVPFEEFCIEFDRCDMTVVRYEEDSKQLIMDLSPYDEARDVRKPKTVTVRQINKSGEILHSHVILSSGQARSHYPRITDSSLEWETDSDIELDELDGLSLEEARQLIDDRLSEWSPWLENESRWLLKLQHSIHTRLISAERLRIQNAVNGNPLHLNRLGRSSEIEHSVKIHARELAEKIQTALNEYSEIAQRKDRSFPQRLMEASISEAEDEAALEIELSKLQAKSHELMNLGLLDPDENAFVTGTSGWARSSIREALSIYVNDLKDKLSVFDGIAGQLRILTRIINERFQYKTLRIDKRDGYVFVAGDEQPIPLASLSSGEQHELVLFYQLLFDVKPNSLILIDEPEISLHVTWQECFLADLEAISSSRDFDVLIATHSPDIIGDHQDWMVGLGSPEPA